jgi:hypothetical protein
MGIIYIAHRLFAFHDRMLASELAQMMYAQHNDWQLFLPYCDTDEDTIVVPKKGYYLFQCDVERLQKLSALVALLHGPSYDDGVCMEMGMAYVTGVPVVLLSTDFLTYSFAQDPQQFTFADPLLEILGASILHLSAPALEMRSQSVSSYQHFWRRNAVALQDTLQMTVDEVVQRLRSPMMLNLAPPPQQKLIYIELSPYGQSDFLTTMSRRIKQKGWACYIATRFQSSCMQVEDAARQDLQMALKSTMLVLDGNGPEVPAGAAFLTGLGLAMKKPRFLYYAGIQITHAHGREENERNLMLLYGCS